MVMSKLPVYSYSYQKYTAVQLKSNAADKDNLIGAQDDQEALALFLNKAAARSAETLRRYEREAVRFTFFIYHELAIDYQSVRLKHLQSYIYFIQNLPKHWLRPGLIIGQPDKVLFRYSVKKGKSTDQVIDILSTFFTFLDKSKYTCGNPAFSLIRSGEKAARGSNVVRYIHDNEWHHIKICLNTMPTDRPKQAFYAARARYMLAITYALALRESELVMHKCSDIHSDGEGGLYLSVLGKGRKRRNLPINNFLLERINSFRHLQGFDDVRSDNFPLAPRQRKHQGVMTALSARGLRFWWQSFMDYCSKQSEDLVLASRLNKMPFHAMRHTALTHLARHMDIEDLAIFAGHDSINTTSQYYHAEAKRLRTLTAQHRL